MKSDREALKRAPSRKFQIALFRLRIERCCRRMNAGLAAIALVLAAATLFMSVLRVSDVLARDSQWGTLPFIEMSTDGPDTGSWSMSD
jgi:hypothetical protein